MNSSPKTAESPIAGNTGAHLPAPQTNDPYQVLDDLMAVVEVFCPVWPERKGFVTKPEEMRL